MSPEDVMFRRASWRKEHLTRVLVIYQAGAPGKCLRFLPACSLFGEPCVRVWLRCPQH